MKMTISRGTAATERGDSEALIAYRLGGWEGEIFHMWKTAGEHRAEKQVRGRQVSDVSK